MVLKIDDFILFRRTSVVDQKSHHFPLRFFFNFISFRFSSAQSEKNLRLLLHNLLFFVFTETSDSWTHWSCGNSWVHPSTAGNDTLTSFAWPDTDTSALHGVLEINQTKTKLISHWKIPNKIPITQKWHENRSAPTFPQKEHVYFECWVISIFFTILRREAPYRVPYLPTIPTFLVRLACKRKTNRNRISFN